jgi:plasmid stability protein
LIKLAALIGWTGNVASITIRNLDDPLKARLRIQAAVHGRSMEDEARDILRTALNQEPTQPANLAAAIRARFAPLGGVDLPEVPREPMREPPDMAG